MCIVLVSTIHPKYPFVLLSNRDEYLARPTARAAWWDAPNTNVLGGRDLHRSVRGTWLGITREGRLAVLTNFREEGTETVEGARSRGEIPIAFLTQPVGSGEGLEEFAHRLVEVEGVSGVGGFSLAFGLLRKDGGRKEGLALISNRTPDLNGVRYSHPDTWGLSNSNYGDRAWPKVVEGEKTLDRAIKESVFGRETEDQFVERCLDILTTDTLPRPQPGQEWEVYLRELRNSIFCPVLDGEAHRSAGPGRENVPADEVASAKEKKPVKNVMSGKYGTQQQTVILVDQDGKCKFVERTLYHQDGTPMEKEEKDRKIEFDIQGWD